MDLIFLRNKAEKKSRKFQFPAKKPPGHLEHLRKHHRPTLMKTLFLTAKIIPLLLLCYISMKTKYFKRVSLMTGA